MSPGPGCPAQNRTCQWGLEAAEVVDYQTPGPALGNWILSSTLLSGTSDPILQTRMLRLSGSSRISECTRPPWKRQLKDLLSCVSLVGTFLYLEQIIYSHGTGLAPLLRWPEKVRNFFKIHQVISEVEQGWFESICLTSKSALIEDLQNAPPIITLFTVAGFQNYVHVWTFIQE